jgi:outer membrane protein assembly factor BamB/YHS domain-containing protein
MNGQPSHQRALPRVLLPVATAALALALAGCGSGARVDSSPPALGGLDPVALVAGREVAGDPGLALSHAGLTYRFAGAMNRALFEENPRRFAVQLDGRCAGAHREQPGAPAIWAVHGGRIYLFCDPACREAFLADPERFVAREPGESVVLAAGADSVTQSWHGAEDGLPQDWPQWGGPDRNFKSPAQGLAAAWPEGGPPRLWSRELGEGFSAISVLRGALYTMIRRGAEEVVVSLDAATGNTRWEFGYPAPFSAEYETDFGPGPHATPLVTGSLVVTAGATGLLHALDRTTGRAVWSHDLIGEFGGTVRTRGYSSSPLAYGDAVIAVAGGEGASLVAFDRRDGSVVWQAQSFHSSPSSPIVIRVDGQDQLVAFLHDEVVGLDPADGQLLWSHPHPTDWGLNASTPVWGQDNLLFVSSAYNGGSRVLRLTRADGGTTVEEVFFTRKMRLHFGNAVRLGDFVFGSSGDFGPPFFAAFDLTTGEPAWVERSVAKASFLYADGRFVILDEDGVLTLATPTAEGLEIHSRAQLLDPVAWTVPSLAGTTLYLRDRKRILALDLR